MSGLLQDLRYAVRTLLKSPGFALIAVLALTLGIGANTAMFTVVNSVLLRPLPYRAPDRLIAVWQTSPAQNWSRMPVSGPNYIDMKRETRLLQEVSLYEPGSGTLTGVGEPEQIPGMRVTTNFFSMLGTKAHLGRLFTEAESRGGRHNVAVVTYGFWKSRLGADPRAIGRVMQVDGLEYTLAGVLPPDFWFPMAAEAFVPWDEAELAGRNRLATDFGMLGRMKRGVTVEQAAAELKAIMRRIDERNPGHTGWTVTVLPAHEVVVEYIRPALLVLLGAVGFVLLIACTNIANLLLARGAARQKEVAIRAALGAGRWRVIRQMLTESLVLSLAGGAGGFLLAVWSNSLLMTLVPKTVPLADLSGQLGLVGINIDGRVLLFTFIVSLLTGLIFGTAPAIAASRGGGVSALKEVGRVSNQGTHNALRGALVVAEVALALVLLIGATLMLRSMSRLGHMDPGFHTQQLLTFEMEVPTDSRYRSPREWANVYQRFVDSIRRQPGLESAALTRAIPLGPEDERTYFDIEGRAPAATGERLGADLRMVSANYLPTLGVPMLRGRGLADTDHADSARVALIDATLARRFFANENPIGHTLIVGRARFEIAGVTGPVKHSGLNQDARPTIYVSYLQVPHPRMGFVIRTAADPASVVRTVKKAVWQVDRNQPIYGVKSMDSLIADSSSAPRLTLVLLGAFAALALLLAAIGIYGVMSYTVNQRRHELGIRMALGAGWHEVLRLVVGRALLLALAGVAIGIAAALALTRVLATLLYGISATDPSTFALVAAALTLVALAASYIPARRAAGVDPIEALRYE